jgi:hypothetical protein
MVIGRMIGWLLLVVALGVVSFEIWLAMKSGGWRPVAAGELWFKLHAPSLNASQAGIQRHVAPWLWDPVITTVLLWPAWAVVGAPGLLLAWAFRKRKPGRR